MVGVATLCQLSPVRLPVPHYLPLPYAMYNPGVTRTQLAPPPPAAPATRAHRSHLSAAHARTCSHAHRLRPPLALAACACRLRLPTAHTRTRCCTRRMRLRPASGPCSPAASARSSCRPRRPCLRPALQVPTSRSLANWAHANPPSQLRPLRVLTSAAAPAARARTRHLRLFDRGRRPHSVNCACARNCACRPFMPARGTVPVGQRRGAWQRGGGGAVHRGQRSFVRHYTMYYLVMLYCFHSPIGPHVCMGDACFNQFGGLKLTERSVTLPVKSFKFSFRSCEFGRLFSPKASTYNYHSHWLNSLLGPVKTVGECNLSQGVQWKEEQAGGPQQPSKKCAPGAIEGSGFQARISNMSKMNTTWMAQTITSSLHLLAAFPTRVSRTMR
jgi:hypothetical protein